MVAGWWRALRTCGMAPRRRPHRGGLPRNSECSLGHGGRAPHGGLDLYDWLVDGPAAFSPHIPDLGRSSH